MPTRFGPWQSAYSRLRRWQAAEVWEQVLAELQRQADADGRLDCPSTSSAAPSSGHTGMQQGQKGGTRRRKPSTYPTTCKKLWTLVFKLLLRSKRNERLKDGEGDLSLRVVEQP